ncbi:hypothetical protein ACIA58_16065 [Kribbella sp. NPDC051586]|uniref:hypothetical protein n=1 Tax=Kribbella sp. NPDC051586 TaxID=3364118 RepID=UPI00379F1A1E
MRQRGDGRWPGHHEITYAAVTRLYQHLAGPDATINGLRQSLHVFTPGHALGVDDEIWPRCCARRPPG